MHAAHACMRTIYIYYDVYPNALVYCAGFTGRTHTHIHTCDINLALIRCLDERDACVYVPQTIAPFHARALPSSKASEGAGRCSFRAEHRSSRVIMITLYCDYAWYVGFIQRNTNET